MIKIKNVSKVYENGAIGMKNVDIEVQKGEFVFIVGHSGSGKSSLMRALLREIEVDSGQMIVNGYDLRRITHSELPYYRRTLGVVFQDFRLLKDKTVYENVAFAMEVLGKSQKEIRKKVPTVLALVGLNKKAKAYPNQLSGGEQQRTALARAIVNKPDILIADEPTGNLDPETTWDIVSLLDEINQYGTTIVMSTHDKSIVDYMQKRVIHIDKGIVIRDDEGGYHYDN